MTATRWTIADLPLGPVAKICGLTRLRDVLLARSLGAWALGFVFAESPRRMTPDEARRLVDGAASAPPPADQVAPLLVGVFGDMTAADIARVVEHVGLDAVQLHGREGPTATEVREALAGWTCPATLRGSGAAPGAKAIMIIQVLPVAPDESGPDRLRQMVAAVGTEADLILLDTRTPAGFGGTGATFPWPLARHAAAGAPFLVAGGIGPDNVGAALRESGAWGVDVSSGIESSPGKKDARLVRRLLARVASARGQGWDRGGVDKRQEGSGT